MTAGNTDERPADAPEPTNDRFGRIFDEYLAAVALCQEVIATDDGSRNQARQELGSLYWAHCNNMHALLLLLLTAPTST